METYILINTYNADDPVLGVYNSELLAQKMKMHFEMIYPNDKLKIVCKDMEYIDRD